MRPFIPPYLALLALPAAATAQAPRITPEGDPSVRNDTIYALAVDSTQRRDERFVYLLDDGVIRLEADGSNRQTYRQVVQILTPEAARIWAERTFPPGQLLLGLEHHHRRIHPALPPHPRRAGGLQPAPHRDQPPPAPRGGGRGRPPPLPLDRRGRAPAPATRAVRGRLGGLVRGGPDRRAPDLEPDRGLVGWARGRPGPAHAGARG